MIKTSVKTKTIETTDFRDLGLNYYTFQQDRKEGLLFMIRIRRRLNTNHDFFLLAATYEYSVNRATFLIWL